MDPYQFRVLVALLEKLLNRQFTLTSAADWPLLVVVGTALVGLIVFMWVDLRTIVKDNRQDAMKEISDVKVHAEKEIDDLWRAMKDCQNECCPRKKNE